MPCWIYIFGGLIMMGEYARLESVLLLLPAG
jgi:hypothetical protein